MTPNLESQYEVVDIKSAQRKIRWICSQQMKQDPNMAKHCKAVKVLNDELWPNSSDFGLDESQFDALKAALTKQFTIIQGPPGLLSLSLLKCLTNPNILTGTGKTYVGLRIAQALLQNVRSWGHTIIGTTVKVSPILVVCYTNHALDQFLEGIIPFCQSIIRIGGKSKSPLLEHFNLKNVKSCEQREKKVPAYIFKNRKECRDTLSEIQSELSELETSIESTNKKVLNSELFSTIIKFNKLQYDDLVRMNNLNTIPTWLGFSEFNDQIFLKDDDLLFDFEEEELLIDNNIDDEFEFDGDEDEILEIENMRLIDGDSDDDDIDQINPRRSIPSTNYVTIAATDPADGFQLQRHQKKMQKNRTKMELKKTESMTEVEAKAVQDIWNLPQQSKWNLYRFWRNLYVQQIEEEIRDQRKKYSNEWVRFVSLRNQEDLEIVQGYSIIGMTTTGAAKYHHIIDGIKPRIISKLRSLFYLPILINSICTHIVVEEAAEVLEAHIITSLCSKTDHLILIGDHQQLKPNPAVYELAKKFNLEVSLFERMIQNGMACHQLKLQHRMRPSISELLVPHIYKELMDHESVKSYEDIKGKTHVCCIAASGI